MIPKTLELYIFSFVSLFLSFGGGIFHQSLKCETKELLRHPIAQHLFQFISVYISFGIFSENAPHWKLVHTAMFYVLFIMITKLNKFFIIIISILLGIMLILKLYIDHYDNIKTPGDVTEENVKLVTNIQKNRDAIKLISKIFLLLVLVGFIYYIIDEDIISTPIFDILKSSC